MTPKAATSSIAANTSSPSARTQSSTTPPLTRESVSASPPENQTMLMRWVYETRPSEMTVAERVEKQKWEKTKDACSKE